MAEALDISDYVLARFYSLTHDLQVLEWSRWGIVQGDKPMNKAKLASIIKKRKDACDKLHLFRGPALEQGVQLGASPLEMGRILDEVIRRCQELQSWEEDAGKTREKRWRALSSRQWRLWEARNPVQDLLRALAVRIQIQESANGEAASHRRALTSASLPVSSSLTIVSLGDQTYQIGNGLPRRLGEREDVVLRSFLGQPALDKGALALATGMSGEDEATILRRLSKKFNGEFARAIYLPGGRGRGGYQVLIRAQK
jgi:hypothetical protein